VLSEETEPDPAALERDVCFVIDPIDGTNELIAGRADFAISVAVFVNGEPVAAVLDLPQRDQRVSCHAGRGASVNGRPITLPARASCLAQARLAVSPGQRSEPTLKAQWRQVDAQAFHPVGALTPKIADVLLGHCDAALYLPWPGHFAFIWDYAAAALLLREAGGTDGVELLDGLPLRHHAGWVAGERRLCHDIRAAVC
jgi:myo-inositol-1(or 4)-monophosphatase